MVKWQAVDKPTYQNTTEGNFNPIDNACRQQESDMAKDLDGSFYSRHAFVTIFASSV